tara:strand:+ start:18 stop:464 length:447 start_codon:yes stop_codon:yes gene_type:complete
MVESISSKNMSKLRSILVRNLSGGSTGVSTELSHAKKALPFHKTTAFKYVIGFVIFLIFGPLAVWGIMSLINNNSNQEVTEETEETTVTTEDNSDGSDNGRETVNINVADSETTRTSGNTRSSSTQRTESVESTSSVESSSCVNGVCT